MEHAAGAASQKQQTDPVLRFDPDFQQHLDGEIKPGGRLRIEYARMVKILEAFDSVEPAMMDSLHEEHRVGATAGIRDWASKPTAAAAERILGSGEPHSASAAA